MPLFHIIQQSNLSIGIWKITESGEELATRATCQDDDPSILKSEVRKQERSAVQILLKTMLNGEEESVLYHPSGKPFLKGGEGFISISHTKGNVAIALHPNHETGIDIERYGDRVLRVMPRFVHKDEEATILNASWAPSVIPLRSNEIYAALLHWSAKETIYKIMGSIDVDLLHRIKIMPFELREKGIFEGREYGSSAQKRFSIHYSLHPDFVLTYTVDK